jgi:uncharacterized protein (PEP-CTERM system associated)
MDTATARRNRRNHDGLRAGDDSVAQALVTSATPRWEVLLPIAMAGAFWSASSLAADWQVTPRVQLKETYTDNVRLARRGFEESDFVTEIDPGVSIIGRGARLQLNLDYAFKYRLYAKNSDANGHDHALRSNALMDVWDRKLFIEANASIAQQDISPLGARASSDVNINDNRTEVRRATLSPFWVSRIGSFAEMQARYTWNRVESSGETSATDSELNGIDLGFSSGPEFNVLGWSVGYTKQKIDSTTGRFESRDLETLTATARYRLTPTVFPLVTVGRDDNSYGSVRGGTTDNFYSVGVEWIPSTRTRVRGEIGERYFGNTGSFRFEHRTRLTTWNLTYSEQIIAEPGRLTLPLSLDTATTLNNLFLSSIPDPILRQQAVQAFIDQSGLPSTLQSSIDFLTERVTLSKRLEGVFGLRGARASLLMTIYRDDREAQDSGATTVGTDPFQLSDRVVQTGYSAIATWKFSTNTAGSVSLGQTRSKYTDADREDTDTNFRLGLTRRFQPRLIGSVEYRLVNRDSNSSAAGDVRENAITGTLSLTF